MLNLANILDDAATRSAKSIAVYFGEESWDYDTLNRHANKVANALTQAGAKAGDRVALSCPNVAWFVPIYYGILKIGAVVVPLNILLKGDEVAYHLRDSGAEYYFCHQGTPDLPLLEFGYGGFEQVDECKLLITIQGAGGDIESKQGVQSLEGFIKDQADSFDTVIRDESDPAVLLYTSGTTGKPKGASLSHSNILWNTRVCADLFELTRTDTMLTVLPLFHSFGQVTQMNASMLVGCANVLVPRFDAELVMDTCVRHKVSVFAGVPTMYWGLLNAKKDEKRLAAMSKHMRMFVSGGAANPVEIIRQVKKVFGLPVYEGYGLSESSPVVTFNHPGQEPLVGSVGVPIWGMEVRIVDKDRKDVKQGESGELICRGHSVMIGYHGKEEATRETIVDGWLHTGDIAKMDERGYIYIVDRAKDLIVRGGYNVYPREIEETILEHEAVSLVAVIGVPHEKYGEEVKAYVVLEAGAKLSEDELINWCKEKMASYKYPREVEFKEALPTNATGKILKRELRA